MSTACDPDRSLLSKAFTFLLLGSVPGGYFVVGCGMPAVEGDLYRHEFERGQMGTRTRIVLYAADSSEARGAAEKAFARIDTITTFLSDYDPDSELNRLSRTAGTGESVAVSDDLWQVLLASVEVARASEGVFDPTIGPLSRLWRRAIRRQTLPSADSIRAALQLVGYESIRLDSSSGRHVTLDRPGTRIDFGGIAKGYAADEALAVLAAEGVEHALVDIGGDIAVGKPPPGPDAWKVGLGQYVRAVAHVRGGGIASSAATFRYLQTDSVRYSHIIDPRTGYGVTHEFEVTVTAPSGMTADAYASWLSVIGPTAAIDVVGREPNAEVHVVVPGGSFQTDSTWTSEGFPTITIQADS